MVQRYSRIHNIDLQKLGDQNVNVVNERLLGVLIEEFDIDKSWEAIHFLITGNKAYSGNHEFSQILSPSDQIFNISDQEYDFYYDEMSNDNQEIVDKWIKIERKIENQLGYLNPTKVKEICKIMLESNFRQILDETDLTELNTNGIYQQNWTNTKETKEYLTEHFSNLTEFLKRAIQTDDIVLVYKPQ